ncbi:MAG: AAA family ATPase [Verrucomicrobia bacterium]|nr:AAA family ATPase [Verrucomicrobiota bacterium]
MSEERPKCEILDYSVKADDYKCFRGEPTGFEQFKQINLIIGKNNTGKSALLDLVEYATPASGSYESPARTINNVHPIGDTQITVTEPFNINKFANAYSAPGNKRNDLFEPDDCALLTDIIPSTPFTWSRKKTKRHENLQCSLFTKEILKEVYTSTPFNEHSTVFRQTINKMCTLPFLDFELFRLIADRDLQPEEKVSENSSGTRVADFPLIESNGNGVSLLYELFKNQDPYVHQDKLSIIKDALQSIYGDDGKFSSITAMRYTEDNWKGQHPRWGVAIQEPNKAKYVTTEDSGSGLKTILLTLAFLHLLPSVKKTDLIKCIFCFEELENNLHPSVQRRLFKYLLDFTRDNGCMLFLTTHSNVAIDIFSKCSDEEAQILHVTHDGTRASVKTIEPQKLGHVLDDLGYQASDILQSNYLIWVEGPSDRIYIKHTLQKTHYLEEDVHYSIMFYGGRLLSHLDFDGAPQWDEAAVTEFINLAKINRNSAVVLDSDRSNKTTKLNATKQRIIDAFTNGENDKCFAWVTKGREIENYIAEDAFKAAVDIVHKDTDWNLIRFGQYAQHTVRKETDGKKSTIDKVKVARELCKSDDVTFELDWDKQIKTLADKIRAANGIPTK